MAPYLMCYFIVILFYIEQKWLFLRNLATILPFVCANFLENLSVLMLWMEVSKWWKISDIPKISIKMRNCKTFYKVETVIPLKEILQSSHNPPPSDSILLNLWNKKFLMGIYRNIQTFVFKVRQECSSWASKNGAVQMFFMAPNRNMFAGKFVKSEKFWLCCGSMLFSTSSEMRFVKWASFLNEPNWHTGVMTTLS